jgi:hypothetical protein
MTEDDGHDKNSCDSFEHGNQENREDSESHLDEDDSDADSMPLLEPRTYSHWDYGDYDAKEQKEDWDRADSNDKSVVETIPETHETVNSICDEDSEDDLMPPLAPRNHWNDDDNSDSDSDDDSVTNIVTENQETVHSINQVNNTHHDEEWLVDSGAMVNVTRSDRFLENVKPCNLTSAVGNGDKVNMLKQGDIVLRKRTWAC